MSVTILTGDCRVHMAAMEPESISAVVTDPPYELGFMGKGWDRSGVAFDIETWRVAFRVLKPGGHLLAFGGPRTEHRMACAIEDAGFEIRDKICWLFGSGFPKSLDVSKAIDKAAGAQGTYGEPKSEAHAGWIERGRMRGDDGHAGYQRPWMQDGDAVDRNARQYIPATPAAEQWAGYGTALKPAYEGIIVARKPLIGTVAANVLAHCTGAINVDACRIGTDGARSNGSNGKTDTRAYGAYGPMARIDYGIGRWPANVVLGCCGNDPHDSDCAAAMLDEQSGERPSQGGAAFASAGFDGGWVQNTDARREIGYGDTGGASRFFYTAKASRSERNKGLDGMPERDAGVGHRATDPGEYIDFVHPAPDAIGAWLREHRERADMSATVLCGLVGAHGAVNHGGAVVNWEREYNRPTPEQWFGLKTALGFDDRYDEVMTTTRPVDRKTFDARPRPIASNIHPTVKPVDLMQWLVRLVTPPGGIVLDPFMGSGSTCIAADREGFDCIGIEISPEYVEIARRRIVGDCPMFAEVTS